MKKSGLGQILLLGIVAVILLALVFFLKGLFPGGGGGGPGPTGPDPEPPQPPIVAPEPSTGPIEITIDGRSYFLNGQETSITEIVKEAESQGEEKVVIIIRKENSQYAEEEKLETALKSSGFIVDMTDEEETQ